MTVTATTCEVSYACNGALTEFGFTFPIFVKADLKVYKVTVATGEQVLQTLTTHYTLEAADKNEDYKNGGTVTTVATWSSDYRIRIVRDLTKTQTSSFEEGGPVSPLTLTALFDKLMMILQEVNNTVDHSLTWYPLKAVAMADDGTIDLPVITNQGIVLLAAGVEGGIWSIKSDGSVGKIAGTTNTSSSDTDGSICVYDGGTYAIIKNRLGATTNLLCLFIYF